MVLSSPAESEIQIGRLGRIRLQRGWYVYVGSALAERTGVLRRVARLALATLPFLVEAYGDASRRRYVVSKVATGSRRIDDRRSAEAATAVSRRQG